MGTEACFHADDAGRQLLEGLDERQPLDLAAERDLAIGSEADDVETSLPISMPIEANAGVVVGSMGCFSGLSGAV